MKIALCFIISYEHILNKESIWREWIEPNKDIINVYFYYKDFEKIKSNWIKQYTLPIDCIYDTTYYHVIPAYISILNYSYNHDKENIWFCLLTDSCCPIISPKRFRYLFYKNRKQSIFSWKEPWWNPNFHKRGNLIKLPKELWLANDPWFILTRENVKHILYFISTQRGLTKTICDGGLANESLFAIIFKFYNKLNYNIICASSHIADWNRRSSTTSPHIFKDVDEKDIQFFDKELERNEYAVFIRKVDPEFSDEILKYYIYEYRKEKDDKLVLFEPLELTIMKYQLILKKILLCFSVILMICILYLFLI
jgi:hypothetical protein